MAQLREGSVIKKAGGDEVIASLKNGAFTEIVKAHPNTSNSIAQLRNIILSPDDAVLSSMQNGDIWIKYK